MKKLLSLILVLTISFLSSCGASKEEAEKFNRSINDLTDKVAVAGNKFNEQMTGNSSESLQAAYNEFSQVISMASAKCGLIKPIDDDRKYYYAAVAHFQNLKNLRDGEMMQMMLSKQKMIADSVPDAAEVSANENRIQKYTASAKETGDALAAEEKAFCEKWGIPVK
ncbi:MAG: hypothetical protein ACRC3B_03255 [Bacteroidia bacterium]